ncbi:S-layer homology domain-containing protein [Paenibacillus chondroitinus]|uniref:S-layer homology domain-containing protein n=1 Tax=Paenibacillus chondroitinus TaxID=59842 RepID=A0ABU6DMU1_9BACL|nr:MULTISPECIES: S-layer homology domain-containing protein [Paenibacillus]MCY9661442.1 S-layer homology domain-containing protein [Paenibacillus anseongense]MEB4799095.1 S-layer homology domain-containing protein [Paenibacillus chondroitinus]
MKKSLSVIVSAAMAVTLFSSVALGATGAKSSADFSDLSGLDAGTKAKFDAMISAGIFDGVSNGVFGLHDKMNRAQFAKVAALIFGLKVNSTLQVSSFSDVSSSDPANGYALPYIEALKAANLTDGFGQGTYNPAGEVTKEQLAAFLIRGLSKDAQAKGTTGVNDNTVSSWAKGYAALAIQLNLLSNQADGTFGGTQAATRDLLVTSSYAAKQQFVPGSITSGQHSEIHAEDLKAYSLPGGSQAQVKSVLQEKTTDGWRVGTVVKLTNSSNSTIRVPDYELRVRTSDGTDYTLVPSASNARSILPQSDVTLSYMTDINVKSDVSLTDVLWIDVDTKVYPKQETLLADSPVGSIVWRGNDAVINDASLMGEWGATFSIPGVTSSLKYSATSLSKQFSGQSPTYIVQVKVQNSGSYAETIPDFTLSGKSNGQSFIGKRVEESPITLNAGEQKYIHFAVTTEASTQLNAFYVLTPESFLKQGQTTPLQYYTGRIGFGLPANGGTETSTVPSGGNYTFGTPMVFEQGNEFINPNLAVSLEELHVTNNEETGNKTGLAKFKLVNKGDKPIPVPALAADLTGKDGFTYTGSRQTLGTSDIAPGTGVVVSYGYTIPTTDQSDQYKLNVQGVLAGASQGQTGYKSTIASYTVSTQSDNDHNNVSLYPFKLNFKSWTLSQLTITTPSLSYSYKLNLDLDITRDPEVLVDNNFSKLKFELVDGSGSSLGSSSFPFSGTNRLVSGTQSLSFSNLTQNQVQNNVSIRVYESVTTPNGEMDRFITELK